MAEGRTLGDPETIAYGLIPRAHRGIVAVNELPDLAERIQVAMLNVMEERDIQVRGYTLRLPLDVLVVASANPEDYTNRGRIITRSRIASVRRSAPITRASWRPRSVSSARRRTSPLRCRPICCRSSPASPGTCGSRTRSISVPGVSARFAIAAAETVAASARHRGALLGEDEPVARVVDLGTVIDVLRGKLEFESGRRAASRPFWNICCDVPRPTPPSEPWEDRRRTAGDRRGGCDGDDREQVAASVVLAALPALPVIDAIAARLGAHRRGERAAALELALEALYLAKKIDKTAGDGRPCMARGRGRDSRYSAYTGARTRLLRRWTCVRRSGRSART